MNFSERVTNKIGLLTKKQRAAIPRLVRALADDQTMDSLLKGSGKVCAWATWYRKGKGWSHQALFMEVLEEARREYEEQLLARAVDEAAEELKKTTPLAAKLAREILLGAMFGDEVKDLPPALRTLHEMATGEPVEVKGESGTELVFPYETKDRRQAARDLLVVAQRTAVDVLDRADVKTAIKQGVGSDRRMQEWLERIQGSGRPRRNEDEDVANVGIQGSDV